ncbi:MAG: Na+/H+ antiporter NhaA [Salibacteraceae bacterium]|nr:Na+/H+ antiporter NhaA [Salibacteraceae bacterium]|tara:strand:- start:3763 stop:5520 length:1758 start_codon:yes stop_codon:yes gene_type:complete
MKKKNSVELSSFIDYSNKKFKAGRPIMRFVMDHFEGEVVPKFHFFSKTPNNTEFQISAKAALSAELQGHFFEMNLLLIEFQGIYTEELMLNRAEFLKLDLEKFKKDFHSDYIVKRLEDDINLAKSRGVALAPSIAINDYLYEGAWDEHALIEAIENANTKPVTNAMQSFLHWGASAAVMLLLAAIAALVFANIGFIEQYEFLRHFKLGFLAGSNSFILPIEVWINDGLMAIFFLLIGLEIKREVISGELSDIKKASMPVIGAIGGMLIPALLYFFINKEGSGSHGWGVPMATDIAFTLGLMALLGKKVPNALLVFISALAVSDDLGAIVVIALFYGHGFHIGAFVAALVIIGIMGVLSYQKVYSKTIYVVLGLVLWFFIFQSGLHATLAGVITAILIPARRRGNIVGIATQSSIIFEDEIQRIKDSDNSQESIRHGALKVIRKAFNRLIGPGEQIEYSLEATVNYSILPLFAFFNTGILVVGTYFNVFTPINLGIIVGLCIGKPLGIVGFCWLADKFKIASLSSGISWPQLFGAACLAGVGFTMSIVVAGAAFEGEMLDGAKLSILIASGLSAVFGLFILKRAVS